MWRWTLKVLSTAACVVTKRWADLASKLFFAELITRPVMVPISAQPSPTMSFEMRVEIMVRQEVAHQHAPRGICRRPT
jgi:hypothetical protein